MTFPEMVAKELARARSLHPQPYHSLHEGLGILWEEFDEFKQEVFRKDRCVGDLIVELVQVACVAQRIVEDLELMEGGR